MARITIEVSGMRDVERRLERLADAAGDLTPAFRDVSDDSQFRLLTLAAAFARERGRGRREAPCRPFRAPASLRGPSPSCVRDR